MKFSVITPTRNSKDMLKRCVGSVRGQTGVDLEHIVLDACSSDGTSEWLANQNGILATSERDDGMYDAINRGWGRATGEIFCWLNSDEQYLPGTLMAVTKAFDAHPEADFLYGDAIVVDIAGNPVAARREIRLSRSYIANGFLNAFSCTLFFRRRLFDSGSLTLDTRYRYAADMDLVLRLLSSGCTYVKLNRYLGLFGIDGSNLSGHSQMFEETSEIQQRYGGLRWPVLRRAVMLGRHFERLITGSYFRADLAYQFAVNEVPDYRYITGRRIPGRYRLLPAGI